MLAEKFAACHVRFRCRLPAAATYRRSRRRANEIRAAAMCLAGWAVGMTLASAQAPPPDPLVRENATVKLSDHVYEIPDFNVGLVPNVGIVVGQRATLVVDTGLGTRN